MISCWEPASQMIAARDRSGTRDEYGRTIIQIGEVKDQTLTGVSLHLPANTLWTRESIKQQLLGN